MTDFNMDPPDHYPVDTSGSSRYTWLPILSIILKIVGFCALVIWACQVVFGCFTLMTSNLDVVGRLITMLAGGFSLVIELVGVLLIFAVAELIIVILDIERSCRHTAETVSRDAPANGN